MSNLIVDVEPAEGDVGDVGVSMAAFFFFFRLRRFFFGLEVADLVALSPDSLPSESSCRFSKGFFSRSEGSLDGEGSLGRIRDVELSLMPISGSCESWVHC